MRLFPISFPFRCTVQLIMMDIFILTEMVQTKLLCSLFPLKQCMVIMDSSDFTNCFLNSQLLTPVWWQITIRIVPNRYWSLIALTKLVWFRWFRCRLFCLRVLASWTNVSQTFIKMHIFFCLWHSGVYIQATGAGEIKSLITNTQIVLGILDNKMCAIVFTLDQFHMHHFLSFRPYVTRQKLLDNNS